MSAMDDQTRRRLLELLEQHVQTQRETTDLLRSLLTDGAVTGPPPPNAGRHGGPPPPPPPPPPVLAEAYQLPWETAKPPAAGAGTGTRAPLPDPAVATHSAHVRPPASSEQPAEATEGASTGAGMPPPPPLSSPPDFGTSAVGPESERAPHTLSRRPAELWDSFGVKALAWVGGVVTLLGVVLMLIIASQRGLISPGARVGIGAALSMALVCSGAWWGHTRREHRGAAQAVTATGFAGLFVAVCAGASLYKLYPLGLSLLLVGVVMAAGGALAVWWNSEGMAALGMLGGLVAAPVAAQGVEPGVVVLMVLAHLAITGAWLRRPWWRTWLASAAAVGVTLLLSSAFIGDGGHRPHLALHLGGVALYCLATVFALLSWFERADGGDRADRLRALAAVPAVVFGVGGGAALLVLHGTERTWWAFGTAAACGGGWVFAQLRQRHRDTRTVLWGSALVGVLWGSFGLLSDDTRPLLLAAQALLLMFIAHRTREPRVWVGVAANILVSLLLTFAHLAPWRAVVQFTASPWAPANGVDGAVALTAAGTLALLGVVFTAAVFLLPDVFEELLPARSAARLTALVWWVWAASTACVMVGEATEFSRSGFQAGHTAMSVLWGLVGVALIIVGVREGRSLRFLGLGLLAATVVKLLFYDFSQLDAFSRAGSFVGVGLLLLAGGVAYQRILRAHTQEPRQRSYRLSRQTRMIALALTLAAMIAAIAVTDATAYGDDDAAVPPRMGSGALATLPVTPPQAQVAPLSRSSTPREVWTAALEIPPDWGLTLPLDPADRLRLLVPSTSGHYLAIADEYGEPLVLTVSERPDSNLLEYQQAAQPELASTDCVSGTDPTRFWMSRRGSRDAGFLVNVLSPLDLRSTGPMLFAGSSEALLTQVRGGVRVRVSERGSGLSRGAVVVSGATLGRCDQLVLLDDTTATVAWVRDATLHVARAGRTAPMKLPLDGAVGPVALTAHRDSPDTGPRLFYMHRTNRDVWVYGEVGLGPAGLHSTVLGRRPLELALSGVLSLDGVRIRGLSAVEAPWGMVMMTICPPPPLASLSCIPATLEKGTGLMRVGVPSIHHQPRTRAFP